MGGDSTTEKYDVVLVATERRPYIEGLGLEILAFRQTGLDGFRSILTSELQCHQFMPLEIASTVQCLPIELKKKVLQQWKLLQDMMDM